MKHLGVGRHALAVGILASTICGCATNGLTNATPPEMATTTPSVITRGGPCMLPSLTKRRINRWAQFTFGHCGNGGFTPLPATWSWGGASGGHLRTSHNHQSAKFKALQPGTYAIIARGYGNGAMAQSTAIVRQ